MAYDITAYKDILDAIGEGKRIQIKDSGTNNHWVRVNPQFVLRRISSLECCPTGFRVAPSTIVIENMEVPEPIRDVPKPGMIFFIPNFTYPEGPSGDIWAASEFQTNVFNSNMMFKSKEDAIAAAKAISQLLKKQDWS